MSAYAVVLVRPLAAGFAAGLLLALAACSASGPEPEVQGKPGAPVAVLHDSPAAPVASEARAELSRKQAILAHGQAAYAPSPMVDALPPGYRDVPREQYQA